MNKVIFILVGMVLMTSCKSREEKLMDAKVVLQEKIDSVRKEYFDTWDKQIASGNILGTRTMIDKDFNITVDTVGNHLFVKTNEYKIQLEKYRDKMKEIDKELEDISLGLN